MARIRQGIFQVKTISPRLVDAKEVRFQILNELRKQATATAKEMRKTVQHWEGDKPTFPSSRDADVTFRRGQAAVRVEPQGNARAVDKWKFLDKGTKIRWAVMGRGFQRKTHPRSLRTNPGKDVVAIRGRRAMTKAGIPPRPGIKPRRWSAAIRQKRHKPFVQAMRDAQVRGFKKKRGIAL